LGDFGGIGDPGEEVDGFCGHGDTVDMMRGVGGAMKMR
jgi:hypothetical protein